MLTDADVDTTSTAATGALPKIVVTEDGRRMRLVDEETLSYFRSRPLRPPLTCNYSAELMRRMGLDDVQVDTMLQASQNELNTHNIHADVLRQYSARGYAYLEIPQLYPDDNMDERN
jgi:hypothetical protein